MLKLAHVKWFVDGDTPFVNPLSVNETMISFGLIVLGVLVLLALDRYVEPKLISKKLKRKLSKYNKYVPDIVRFSTSLLLLINFQLGYLFAPNVINNGSGPHHGISLVLLSTAILLLVGAYVRISGIILSAVYVFSLLIVEPWNSVFDHVEYLAIGAYLYLAPPGQFEFLKLRQLKKVSKKVASQAGQALRVLVGVDLVILAISEKLGNLSDASYFLQNHSWNILSFAGVSDRWFIIFAGVTELVIGLSLILNLATRITTLVLVGIMLTTAALLGLEEVYGHLFAIGVVSVVWFTHRK